MGVFDKLKNVFFEEEIVEVEEPIKKPKKEKRTIAKKVDLPEKPVIKEEKTEREKQLEEEVVERVEKKENDFIKKKKEQEYKFPMEFEDDDFKVEGIKEDKKKRKEKRQEEYDKHLYNELTSNAYNGSYGMSEYKKEEKKDFSPAGLYEGEYKEAKKVFRPTPIISPIYGVLDKNYKKEEIQEKKEIRLSTASSKKVDLDSVRKKAYGDLVSDITDSMMEEEPPKEPEKKQKSLEESLYDLNDSDNPVVTNVTMGDAEEYFNDLGLEYNVDYKDHGKEVATGRRSEKNKKEKEEKEDSLFDLIDSMYQDQEEE